MFEPFKMKKKELMSSRKPLMLMANKANPVALGKRNNGIKILPLNTL